MTGNAHILLLTALITKLSLHHADAIIFSIGTGGRTSTKNSLQPSTIREFILPKPFNSAKTTSDSTTAITDLKMTHTVYWFRKALRIHDNPSLVKSIKSTTNLDPIFCLDPWFVKSGRVGVNRMSFLLEALTDLDQNLRKVGSKLLIVHGNPVEEIPK
jgi:hypothetical protein